MGIIPLKDFLAAKGVEYAPFDPHRAVRIYEKLLPFLPDDVFKIHLVGTNGKGTTGRFIAKGLMNAGKKVLHFTSPHLFSFNERFYKNGKDASDEELEAAHAFLSRFDFMQSCSYFEYATFLAMVLCQDVDYAVIEAGMGGEYDSTSVLKREISVFTSISLDHCETLGYSIEEIASTKLKCMTKTAFIAPQPFALTYDVAEKIALERKSKLLKTSQTPGAPAREYAQMHGLAPFLTQNLQTALEVIEFLGHSERLVLSSKLDLRARAEKIAPNVTIDVGHNQSAASELAKLFSNKKAIAVYNSYRQKDVKSILGTLKPILKKILIIDVDDERIIDRKELEEIISSLGIAFETFDACKTSDDEEYLVFGSFSVVKQFLEEKACRTSLSLRS